MDGWIPSILMAFSLSLSLSLSVGARAQVQVQCHGGWGERARDGGLDGSPGLNGISWDPLNAWDRSWRVLIGMAAAEPLLLLR